MDTPKRKSERELPADKKKAKKRKAANSVEQLTDNKEINELKEFTPEMFQHLSIFSPGSFEIAGIWLRSIKQRKKRFTEINKDVEQQVYLASQLTIDRKRRKINTTPKAKTRFNIQRDANGQPILPQKIENFTLISLGKVIHDRPKFHSSRYIWPVGFKSSRQYNSQQEIGKRCFYFSEIIDGGTEPKFRITCEDGSPPIVQATASGAWMEVVRRVADLRERETGYRGFTQISGPDMFGFSNISVIELIQQLPGAEKCKSYKFQTFDEDVITDNTPNEDVIGSSTLSETVTM